MSQAFGEKLPCFVGLFGSLGVERVTAWEHEAEGEGAAAEERDLQELAPARDGRGHFFSPATAAPVLGGAVDRLLDPLVHPAAAEIRAHHRVDLGVGRSRLGAEERGRRHDLAGLAVAALRDVLLDPRRLERVEAVRGQAFDGRDLRARDLADRRHAGSHRLAIEVHGARAAEGHAAAEFGAGEIELVAEHPEERRVGRDVDLVAGAVDAEGDHRLTRTPRSR